MNGGGLNLRRKHLLGPSKSSSEKIATVGQIVTSFSFMLVIIPSLGSTLSALKLQRTLATMSARTLTSKASTLGQVLEIISKLERSQLTQSP